MIRLLTILITLLLSVSTYSQKYIEPLSRGAVAVPCEKGNFISWRYLATDPEDIYFDLFRDGTIIASNIRTTTCVTDTLGKSTSQYTLVSYFNGTKTITLGTSENPIKVAGSVNGTAVTAGNYADLLCGATGYSSEAHTVYASF